MRDYHTVLHIIAGGAILIVMLGLCVSMWLFLWSMASTAEGWFETSFIIVWFIISVAVPTSLAAVFLGELL